MIIGLTIKNWRSFREETIFSMVASGIRAHNERVPKVKKYRLGILPCAAIYGGNASGKTNLFKALEFMKFLITKGTQVEGRIPVEPFRLDDSCITAPVELSVDLLIDETIYEYSFAVTESHVVEERLIQKLSTREKTLFHRSNNQANLNKELKEYDRLNFVFMGTRDNQLFLTNAISQKIDEFRPVYEWFKRLMLIGPDHRFDIVGAAKSGDSHFSKIGHLLDSFDTNISNLYFRNVNAESLDLPEELFSIIKNELKEGESASLMPLSPVVLMREKGEIRAQKIMTVHRTVEGEERYFDIEQESDGSVRMIDLLPALLDLVAPNSNSTMIIDELDRSLHTQLSKAFISKFLTSCSSETRSQLIFTTHDVNLMTQNLFRKDEFWVAEHNSCGESTLTPFSDYADVRVDKDIRKSYLQGRMGGVPRILETI